MPIYVNDSDVWRLIEQNWVRNAGSWYYVKTTYINDSGTWRPLINNPYNIFSDYSTNATTYWLSSGLRGTYDNVPFPGVPRTPASTVSPYSSNGTSTTFVVPQGISQITVKMWGGGGSSGYAGQGISGAGGGGGYVEAIIPVTGGETLTIRVGGGGNHPYPTSNPLIRPAEKCNSFYNANSDYWNLFSSINVLNLLTFLGGSAGSGGGYSGIFRGTTPLAIAGGGGGGGGGGGLFTDVTDLIISGSGGAGGGSTGASGQNGQGAQAFRRGYGGTGGSQISGGVTQENPFAGFTYTMGSNGGQYYGGAGANSPYDGGTQSPQFGGYAGGGIGGGGWGGCSRSINFGGNIILFTAADCGGGGGAGYYGGAGGQCGAGDGGGGGGGGSNYIIPGATVLRNLQGSGRIPGDVANGLTQPFTTFLYSSAELLSNVPRYSFLQGGIGYGGAAVSPTPGLPASGPTGENLFTVEWVRIGNRGENGLVNISW